MSGFQMCKECDEEYHDPRNRRFHAQPIACSVCGPHVWLESSKIPINVLNDPILETQRILSAGHIVAVKGLGGFHLACDASNPLAVDELRHRKLHVDKPFAIMMPDIQTIEKHCILSQQDRDLLRSPQRRSSF
jgi:hydrogenase maturation protein HypF